MLGCDADAVDAQRVELWLVHEVVVGVVAVGQEATIVDVDLVAGEHAVEPEDVGVAGPVAGEDVARDAGGVQAATRGLAGEDA